MKWWTDKLLEGKRLPAVGGSDFHRDYGPAKLLAVPTTITYAKSNSAEDIMDAIREGRCVVTNSPNSSMIYLDIEGAQLGDSIALGNGLTGKCTATKLHRGFVLRVYNNDKLIYEHRANAYEKTHTAHFGIKETGFVRAEIDYRLSRPVKKLLGFGERNFLAARGADVPETADEMFWAFTNPIWIV